ncbi:MAG: SMC family ATPase, partial [Muribaculaceae bacterium]|nr:SMC family ATPase [Muribaculaceae bacterium]
MKIKRLLIRNIASIEQGEIDFENGLIDYESGKPASLFLITGDTGSGKSVILDCIAMSLYGTTPRVKSVNGVKNNVYRNSDGEEIAVNDITQYTRIGISWKDECYSELSFSGNDDIDYIARYSLGRTSHRNYRKPEWTLKIGDSEIIENRKDEIRERILSAVGLTFEQFSRMAMLAQGQFATFLTGKKEERERILEQLTATDIFSRYGEAISIIYKNAKQESDTSKKIYEEFRKNILDDSTRKELTAEQSEKNALATTCQSATENLRKRILCTEAIIKAGESINALNEESAKLKAIEETPEYRKDSKILQLWDATTSQREFLSDKIKAYDKLDADKKLLQEKKSEFNFLSGDLATRKEAANAQSELLEQKKLWIDSKEPLKELFTNSTVVISDIDRFESTCAEIGKKEKAYINVKAAIDELNKSILSLKEDASAKNKACLDCEEQIKQKTQEREDLNPTSLRNEKEIMMKRESALNDLSSRLVAIESERQDFDKAEKETAEIAQQLSELKSKADKASEESTRLEKEKDAADSRYRTMLMSVKKNFELIRKQLVDEHASNCPLCGQSIKDHLHEWSSKEYFSGILSPLEKEKNKCDMAYKAAKKKADDAVKDMNTTSGSLKAKEDDLKKRKKSLNKNEKKIREIILSLELENSENLASLIAEEVSVIKDRIEVVSKKLEQTDRLQKDIDSLLKKKSTLDNDYSVANNTLHEALNTLTQKEEEYKLIIERISELIKEKESLKEKITRILKDYADDWHFKPAEVTKCLKKDSKEYLDKTTSYSKEEEAHSTQLKTLQSIESIQETLTSILEQIEPLEEDTSFDDVSSFSLSMLQEYWHNFHIEVSGINNRILDNTSKISESDKKLEEYYLSSGISEATLRQLLEAA